MFMLSPARVNFALSHHYAANTSLFILLYFHCNEYQATHHHYSDVPSCASRVLEDISTHEENENRAQLLEFLCNF